MKTETIIKSYGERLTRTNAEFMRAKVRLWRAKPRHIRRPRGMTLH